MWVFKDHVAVVVLGIEIGFGQQDSQRSLYEHHYCNSVTYPCVVGYLIVYIPRPKDSNQQNYPPNAYSIPNKQ